MTEHFTGSLMYGDEYGEDVGQEVLFELELERSNSEFSGVSRDISGFGVNESPALVKGSLVNDRISFIKQYQSFHYAEKQTSSNRFLKGPKILYNGTLDQNTGEFYGTWKMPAKTLFFGLIKLTYPSSGSWRMKKTED
ncbi:hypothetical protein Oweho_1284 [Owenweeksia hongkongensis DSM 17368]|uniref:Uncharacterized protein n=1 Tax=Owenweeksia hongkongensis (strain DSM 17368 / CIP 108786 / JCM 12287 / NRRL B-23963 / UST20020801) TaxID=926562 RepID=G8R6U9_OWEHD|nr:hypothetical protein [Owenweeksia hongkongensis]AEV32284.1 hypothetical protein Oweho_1284 [Owenweeksia hongkongensis DSM 17368]